MGPISLSPSLCVVDEKAISSHSLQVLVGICNLPFIPPERFVCEYESVWDGSVSTVANDLIYWLLFIGVMVASKFLLVEDGIQHKQTRKNWIPCFVRSYVFDMSFSEEP